jgi:hypothetical protein
MPPFVFRRGVGDRSPVPLLYTSQMVRQLIDELMPHRAEMFGVISLFERSCFFQSVAFFASFRKLRRNAPKLSNSLR